MNKPTSLFTASPSPPSSPPSSKTGDALANDKQMSFSLLKCYDRVIERIYSSITLQSWLHEACGFFFFLKKKKWLHRERERERKERKKKRERERILPLIYTESVLPDVLSRSSEMVEKARVEDKGGDSASGERSHIHHHLFVYIEATNHLDESAKGRNRKENL